MRDAGRITIPRRAMVLAGSLALLGGLAACGDSNEDATQKINGDIHVVAGKSYSGVDSVNGSIQVDENASLTNANTVNGSIDIGAHATAESLKTVNGSIVLGAGAHLTGSIKSVNGSITLRTGADTAKGITNVNGNIDIDAAHVGGGIRTVNSNITLMRDTHIDGGIVVEKPSGVITFNGTPPRIVIGPGVTVQGELRFERPVTLYVSDRATIGTVTGATAVQFSGDKPPG
jgi:DUF4097 and DUF4098 domain-containing protein YvlB